jgi:hypothetical protein
MADDNKKDKKFDNVIPEFSEHFETYSEITKEKRDSDEISKMFEDLKEEMSPYFSDLNSKSDIGSVADKYYDAGFAAGMDVAVPVVPDLEETNLQEIGIKKSLFENLDSLDNNVKSYFSGHVDAVFAFIQNSERNADNLYERVKDFELFGAVLGVKNNIKDGFVRDAYRKGIAMKFTDSLEYIKSDVKSAYKLGFMASVIKKYGVKLSFDEIPLEASELKDFEKGLKDTTLPYDSVSTRLNEIALKDKHNPYNEMFHTGTDFYEIGRKVARQSPFIKLGPHGKDEQYMKKVVSIMFNDEDLPKVSTEDALKHLRDYHESYKNKGSDYLFTKKKK